MSSPPPATIVLVHNFYQQAGGEDQVFADETALLESRGHTIIRHTVHNDTVNQTSKLSLAAKTIWNRAAHKELHNLVRQSGAKIVHFHNTFPLLSPAAYDAARTAGAAVVQTLHNYRLICPSAIFFRDDHVCEDCLGKTIPWPAVVHRCYRDSAGASAVTAAMLTVHRARGSYRHDVDAYIALTEFARGKFIEAGLPAEKLAVKPNFVFPDPAAGSGSGNYALFVGRLNESKGIDTLLSAWKQLTGGIKLKILGDGELANAVRDAAANDPRIEYLGRRPLSEVYDIMGNAGALIFPSVWYEGLPKTIIESFAKATPVIASNLGSMIELITKSQTGFLFRPGDPASLADTITRALAKPGHLQQMRIAARAKYEACYTADKNYALLMNIYNKACDVRGSVDASLAGAHAS